MPSDPGSALNILAANLHDVSDGEYTTLREVLKDYAHNKDRIRQCSCGTYGEDGHDGTLTADGWRCLGCLKTGAMQ